MKTSLLLMFFTSTSFLSWGQNCGCDKDTLMGQWISCKPKTLDNYSKIYWNFNCDSSWLTYENSIGYKKTLYSLEKDFIELTTRIGHVYFQEFKTTVLFTNKVISGCCDPDDYYLYDKSNGDSLLYLGRALYVSDNKNIPFVVSITNSGYNDLPQTDYNSLTIYNLDNRKSYKVVLPKGDIEKGMGNNRFMFPEDMFDTPVLENDILIIKYHIDKYLKGKPLEYKTIKVDLKKYSS